METDHPRILSLTVFQLAIEIRQLPTMTVALLYVLCASLTDQGMQAGQRAVSDSTSESFVGSVSVRLSRATC